MEIPRREIPKVQLPKREIPRPVEAATVKAKLYSSPEPLMTSLGRKLKETGSLIVITNKEILGILALGLIVGLIVWAYVKLISSPQAPVNEPLPF